MRSSIIAIGLAALFPSNVLALSGSGHSTRYWDCCKPSCAWSGKAAVSGPVRTCDKNDKPLASPDTKSACDGGSAYACSNNAPWLVNKKVAYGFAATSLNGASEKDSCCACFALKFTNGPVAGQTMVVQSTNTGGDLSNNQFDIQMPGGGVGLFNGCASQFGGFPGKQYGGISSKAECNQMPPHLKPGCLWRFNWFKNADNPDFTFKQVQCPKEIVAKSKCRRDDDASFPPFKIGTTAAGR